MTGYPIGAVLSSLAAATIIPQYGWQAMFKVAGITSVITLPIVYFFLQESSEFLDKPVLKKSPAVGKLLTEKYQKSTLILWLAIFVAFASLYF